jgi:phage-related protein
MSAAGQLFTAAAGALPTLMDETATGAEKANAAFSGIQGAVSAVGTMFGPIGMGVATLVNGALSLIKSIFPGIERAFMSAKEKLAELQNTVK